jgi:quinone-modifying oxidoreductase subunit QmoB
MDKRIGVYLCAGCSIAESVDVEELAGLTAKRADVSVCRAHSFLCGGEGTATIRRDLADGSVTSVVIAACSPRAKTERFRFEPDVVVERVNWREQVAWCHEPGHEDTRMLALDCLSMGIAKAAKMESLVPLSGDVSRTILVLGGGVAGIAAAIEGAKSGYEMLLVERSAQLGGYIAGLKTVFPTEYPCEQGQSNLLAAKIEEVLSHPRVTVLCSTKLAKTEGQPGMFDVTLETAQGSCVRRVGAIVMATGWKPYDASNLAALGYGLPDVVTNAELETAVSRKPITRSDGKRVTRVLFVQCAGSRDPKHLPYCSSTCCMTTLKQIGYFRAQNPDIEVYVVYRDIFTPGQYEKYFATVQDHPLNFFVRGTVAAVARTERGQLSARIDDTSVGAEIDVSVDMIVLAAGMTPNSADNDAILALREARRTVERSESDSQRKEAQTLIERLTEQDGAEILNLEYRQGPDLPVFQNGFVDSNFVCFPYETKRTGIYAAGAVRAPMDSAGAAEDACGAVMKAVQCVELARRGQAAHPRSGDLSYPDFALRRCTLCKRCTVECPFGAIDEDERGEPRFNPYRCRRCGICMGACPERIVSFGNYSVDMIAGMIKAIDVPDEFEDKPRVLIFACENDAYPALDMAGTIRAQYDASVRIISLRCLGSMNIVWIADALSRGIDGVMLMGCKFGEDYQCHFIRGSELASIRMQNVKETLGRLRLDPGRIELAQVSIDDHVRIPALIDEFVARVRSLGPNPYKGF